MTTTEPAPTPAEPFVTDQIADSEASATESDPRARRARSMRPILWRLHFIGGFLIGPVIISLAITGILFAWNPQIDDARFGDIMHASNGAENIPLSEQAEAAQAAHPDFTIVDVTPANGGDNSVFVMAPPSDHGGHGDHGGGHFGPPEGAINVYVDPSTGQHTGDIKPEDLSGDVLRSWHSSWTLGDDVAPVTELAASWFFVSMLTGVYLWWPGLRKRGSAAFGFRRGLKGRRRLKEMHNAIGLALFVPMVFLVITGLTWTQITGDHMNTADKVLAREALAADGTLVEPAAGQASIANIDVAYEQARQADLVEPITITVPTEDAQAWQVASNDARFPVERDKITVDGSTGQVVDAVDYSDENWFNRLSTAGILFHQAELFGLPLQIFMTILAALIVVMIVYGYRMWWQRRPAGGMGTPPPVSHWVRNAPLPLLAAVVFLGWLLPVLAISVVVCLVIEAGWRWAKTLRTGEQLDSPALVAIKSLVIAGLGVAMLAAPTLGEGEREDPLPMFARAGAWFWGRPLGAVLLAVAVFGLAAVLSRPRHDGSKPAEAVPAATA